MAEVGYKNKYYSAEWSLMKRNRFSILPRPLSRGCVTISSYQCFITPVRLVTNPIVCPTLGDHNDVASHGDTNTDQESAGKQSFEEKNPTKPFENIWYDHQPLSANIL